VEFFVEFLMVDGIDIHQLNVAPFRILEFFVETPFKKCMFYICLTINA
jgi:hypothetical protein